MIIIQYLPEMPEAVEIPAPVKTTIFLKRPFFSSLQIFDTGQSSTSSSSAHSSSWESVFNPVIFPAISSMSSLRPATHWSIFSSLAVGAREPPNGGPGGPGPSSTSSSELRFSIFLSEISNF